MPLIGATLIETLVHSVACSHLVKGRDRIGLLLIAAPESGKTTIAKAATCKHVQPIAVITGKSVLAELRTKETEFLLFNDMAAVRALSKAASAMLIVLLNQIVNGEAGRASFAGQDVYDIDRPLGIIGCIPFTTFNDKRSHWQQMGFVSRMVPFAYRYSDDLVIDIKNSIDRDHYIRAVATSFKVPANTHQMHVSMPSRSMVRVVRTLADARARALGQIGIRILQHYHTLVRAHALLYKRTRVTDADLEFLSAVDAYVSITECKPL